MRNIAVILAAGSGNRFESPVPKQYLHLGGKTVIEYSLDTFQAHPLIDEICLVYNPAHADILRPILAQERWAKLQHKVVGGKERSDSTKAALAIYKSQAVNLLLHDAARPLVSEALITRVCRSLERYVAVTPALPCIDTLAERLGEEARRFPERSDMLRLQTPQGFSITTLIRAYDLAEKDPGFRATDDCGVVKKYLPDVIIHIVEGEEINLKLTRPADLPHLSDLQRRAIVQPQNPTDQSATPSDPLVTYRLQQLRPLQLRMLDILTTITNLLDQNGISYWLAGGTLLGAVRHAGFIPWDDDVDINIMATDKKRVMRLLEKELPAGLTLQRPTKRFPLLKVRDLNSFLVEFADDFTAPYPKGIYVDIFPQVEAPNISRKWAKRIAKNYCKANSILHRKHYYSLRSVAELCWFSLVRCICGLSWRVAKLLFRKSPYLSDPINLNGYGVMHRKDGIFPLKKIRFEEREFSVPADTSLNLTEHFGPDWQQLPPPEKRQVHAVFYQTHLL